MELTPLSFLVLVTGFSHVLCTFKMCAFPSLEPSKCELLELGNSNVSCVRVSDSVDCAIKLREGKADFAVFTAEEAVLASHVDSVDASLNVLGEIRFKSRMKEPHYLEMVVVVKNSVPGVFADLERKKLCHPGLGTSHVLTDRFLKLFERKIVRRTCSYGLPEVQQEISDMAFFFGPSCRPGVWAADVNLDRQLKEMYPSLCKLCDTRETCSYNTQNTSSYSAALDCLTLKDGDITFVPLETVQSYFGLGVAGKLRDNARNYSYLCPDQTKIPLTSSHPCIWENQPWDLVVSRNKIAADLKTRIMSWTNYTKVPTGPDAWQTSLKLILLHDDKVLNFTNSTVQPSHYIHRGADDSDQPTCSNVPVKWCTTSKIENEKCEWLRVAARTQGLRPYFNCVQRDGVWSCLNSVANGSADTMSIKTDIGYVARKSYNLSAVVFEDNLLQGNYKIIAVVKRTSRVQSFSDLRNKNACFPEYHGLSYIAFVNIVQQNNLLKNMCPTKYFSMICAPGAQMFNTKHRLIDLSSLCSICPPSTGKDTCSANFTSYERTVRAMRCLDISGDVAFINVRNLLKGNYLNTSINTNQYNVLCKNGTLAVGTLSVDDNCALAVGVPAEIVARQNRTQVDDINLKEMFLQLDRWFGTVGLVREGAMRMFDLFKGQKGLLFKDTTISLVNADETNYNLINSYKSLLQNVSNVCSSATMFSVSILVFILTAAVPLLQQ